MGTPTLRKRGKDSYFTRVELPQDPDTGKRRQKTVTFRGTKREAQRQLIERLNQIPGAPVDHLSKLTVAKLLDRWFKDAVIGHVAPNVAKRYLGAMKNHIAPALGQIALRSLRPAHMQHAYGQWMTEPTFKTGRPLTERTVHLHHTILNRALGYAIDNGLLSESPMKRVNHPKLRKIEYTLIDPAEVGALIDSLAGTDHQLPVLLAYHAGLRRGEVLGLSWASIDLDRGTLRVRQTLSGTQSDPEIVPHAKTNSSHRIVPLTRDAIEALREQQRKQHGYREELAEAVDPLRLDLVCTDAIGRPLATTSVDRTFKAATSSVGFPQLRFHDLRHAHATHMLEAGVNPKVVQQRLGHLSSAITMDVYAHVSAAQETRAADLFQQYLDNAGSNGDRHVMSAANGSQI